MVIHICIQNSNWIAYWRHKIKFVCCNVTAAELHLLYAIYLDNRFFLIIIIFFFFFSRKWELSQIVSSTSQAYVCKCSIYVYFSFIFICVKMQVNVEREKADEEKNTQFDRTSTQVDIFRRKMFVLSSIAWEKWISVKSQIPAEKLCKWQLLGERYSERANYS